MQRTSDLLVDKLSAYVRKPPVLDARGAGGFAGATGEAAVKVQLRAGGGRDALQHLFHQVDAPARAVQLIAEQLVSRAGGRAKPAMHALSQDGISLRALGRALDEIGQCGLHFME